MARPLGWNPELLGPGAWDFLQRHLAGHQDRFVGGEGALAGFWFHHRLVTRLEVVLPTQAALNLMQSQMDQSPRQSWPGFARYDVADLMVDHTLVLDEIKPEEEEIRADSLRDLAADRLLRLASGSDPTLLVDLYFLHRARVDLLLSARDAASKDLGLTPSALAVVLAQSLPPQLPKGLLRPVEPSALATFLDDLILQFGMQVST